MASPLGFVVLARRPGRPDQPVSAVFPAYPNGLEQAQNVLESRQKEYARQGAVLAEVNLDQEPEEYVIGEITERTP